MNRRSAFTITELLVSMALIVFIMSILATAFAAGSKAFRDLKALGDMNERLRTASSLLRDDLQADHFDGRKKLSDPNFWSSGPPREGFFRIWQGSLLTTNPGAPYFDELTDVDYGIRSVRATDHVLHMTVKKRGNEPKDFYRASVPSNASLLTVGNPSSRFQDPLAAAGAPTMNGVFTTQWAEVVWFLRPNGHNANGTPLYTLYRRQRAIVANPETGVGTNLNWPGSVMGTEYNNQTAGTHYLNVSCRVRSDGRLHFNTPSDLTVPQYRFGMQNAYGGFPARADGKYPVFQQVGTTGADPVEEQTNPNLQGADVVITDVVSFAVLHRTTGNFATNLPASSATTGNPNFVNTNGPFVFDSWTNLVDDQVDYSLWNYTNTTTPLPPALENRRRPLTTIITALQIQLRVWDSKTEKTRQLTIIVDM